MSDDRVARYFMAWQTHDISTIRELFSADAIYDIKPRNRILIGREEICNYWMRNSERQEDLALNWFLTSSNRDRASASFIACFYDKTEKERQTIRGVIDFVFNVLGQMASLSEIYEKTI